MTQQQIINEISPTATGLLEVLETFTNEQFNIVPFQGSWTPGQVAEHVLKSCAGGLQAVNGSTRLADRDPAEHVESVRSLFLNFEIKMQGPEFVQPSNEPKDKHSLIKELKATWKGIAAFAPENDLTLLCTDFPMPAVGEMTRLEWINFLVVHTQRHIHQLKNIAVHFE